MFWQGSDGKSLLMLEPFHGKRTSVCHLQFSGYSGLRASFPQGPGSAQGLSVLIHTSRITYNSQEKDF